MFNIVSVVLFITKQCNAKCDICAISCSPETKDKMPLEHALNYVHQAHEIGVKHIALTGGEPFLFYDDLLDIISTVRNHNMNVTVNTNAFWANDYNKTLEMLTTIVKNGVKYLTISLDNYHLEYVNINNIKNILRAAKRINFKGILLYSAITKSSIPLSDIIKHLDYEHVEIPIKETLVIQSGRAEEILDKDDFIKGDFFPMDKCDNLRILSIFPNGDTYPCCSAGGFTAPLFLGNAKEFTLKELSENQKNNIYCKTIATKGLGWIKEFIENTELSSVKYANVCDLCYKVFNNVQITELIKKELIKG